MNDELIKAVISGDIETIKQLLQNGTDVNAQDSEGTTALMHAVERQNNEIFHLLLENKADVNLKNKIGETALTYAVEVYNIHMINFLRVEGANLNSQTVDGQTALMLAANHVNYDRKRTKADEDTSVDMVEMLLCAGADACIQDVYGNTALTLTKELQFAMKKQTAQKIKLLRQAEKRAALRKIGIKRKTPQTDLEKENLRGKVKSVSYIDSIEVYNRKGFKVYYHELLPSDNIATRKEPHEYAEVIEYYADGKKRTEYSIKVDVDDAGYRAKYIYQGNVCTVKTYFGKTEDDRSEKLVFDDNGQLIEQQFFSDFGKTILFKESYEYENGKLTRKYEFSAEDVTKNIQVQRGELYRYDSRGNLAKSVVLCQCCPQFERTNVWHDFTYSDFDSHGNWQTKTGSSCGFDDGDIIKREIEYWV